MWPRRPKHIWFIAELAKDLAIDDGRVGVIVPSEILSSDASKDFFQSIINHDRLRSSFAFENEEFIFPGIANVNRFTLLTLGSGSAEGNEIKLAFYLRRAEHLSEPDRIFSLKASDFSDLNPNTLTCPVFRTRFDADLTARIYKQLPVLILETKEKAENPWGVRFMRMFDMANDSDLFVDDSVLSSVSELKKGARIDADNRRYFPLYEGKFIWHFDHRFSSYHNLGKIKGRGGRGLPPVQGEEYANPGFEITPRYWIEEKAVQGRLAEFDHKNEWLMGWRDVANAKVERTMVCGVIPRWGANHKLPLLFTDKEPRLAAGLLGNFSSITFDFVTRQKMGGTSFAYFYLKQLPILPPTFYTAQRLDFIVPRVLELTYTSHSLAPFARDLGYDGPPFAWDEDRRALLRAELDAFYARAYGLDRDELRYILDPADVKGPDYPSETFRVLKEKEIRHHGEYRTRRLVLAAWDRMEANGEFTAMGM